MKEIHANLLQNSTVLLSSLCSLYPLCVTRIRHIYLWTQYSLIIFRFFSLFFAFFRFFFALFCLIFISLRFFRLIFAYFTFIFASDLWCFASKWIMWNQAFFSLPSETKFSLQFQISLPKRKWGRTLMRALQRASQRTCRMPSINLPCLTEAQPFSHVFVTEGQP